MPRKKRPPPKKRASPSPKKRASRSRKTAPAAAAAGPAKAELEELTKAEAARRLGLTERRLEQLVVSEKDLPCIGRGATRRFLWPALREWRDKQLVQQGVRSVKPDSLDEARKRKLTAEAAMAEIDLGVRRGQLMPATLFQEELEAAYGRVRAALLNAPSRYAPQLLERFAGKLTAADLRHIEDFLGHATRDIMAELEAAEDVPEDDDA